MASELSEWRQTQVEGGDYTLPSGLVMRLRRVGILDLVEQGSIPSPLLAKVEKLSSSRRSQLSLKDFHEYVDLINATVKAVAIDPPVSDVGSDGVLAIGELPMLDRVTIFNWANPGIGVLEPFRPEEK